MQLHSLPPKWLRDDERGTALVLVALVSTVMLGMAALAVDVGMILVERRQLQNAVDAAVLAAAAELPSTNAAVNAAIEFSNHNGYALAPGDVWISSTSADNDTVTVTNRNEIPLFFARVLGHSQATPEAVASAQLGTVVGDNGVLPFGIEDQVFNFGDQYCLKLGTGACPGAQTGNFHALDIDDNANDSATIYRETIKNGSQTTVRIGDVKNVVSGNMAGPTMQGLGCNGNAGRLYGNNQTFADVVQDHGDGTYTVLDWNSPRLALVPIVEFDGNSTATIEAFGVFFIDGCQGNDAVAGTFIQALWPGAEWGPLAWGGVAGAFSIRLTQ